MHFFATNYLPPPLPPGISSPDTHSSRMDIITPYRSNRDMDIAELDQLVQLYLQHALAPSTQRTYSAAQRLCGNFCSLYSLHPYPIDEHLLCHYVSHLAHDGLSHRSIKSSFCYSFGSNNGRIRRSTFLEYAHTGIPAERNKILPSQARHPLDSPSAPTLAQVNIKASKTDPF